MARRRADGTAASDYRPFRPIARFGPPFTLERGDGEAAAGAVMAAIAALLPPALRGPHGAPDAPQS